MNEIFHNSLYKITLWLYTQIDKRAAKSRGKLAAPTTFAEGEVGSSGDQTPTAA